jgi:hypothetical protein
MKFIFVVRSANGSLMENHIGYVPVEPHGILSQLLADVRVVGKFGKTQIAFNQQVVAKP